MPRLAGQQDLGRTASDGPRTPAGMDAEAADWMQDHQDKVREVNRNARINDLQLQAMGGIQDLETEVMNDPEADPGTLEATFRARAERLRDRIAEAIKDPQIEQPFRDYYGHLSGRSRAKVASLARERIVADGLASLDRSLDRYEAHYAGLTDAEERGRVKDLVQRKISDAIDTDLLTLDDGVRTFRTWEGDVERAWLDRQVTDWAGRQSGALAAQRGFATGRFGDPQLEEAWNRRDPEARKALANNVLKQLDAQRTAAREAAEAAVAARKNETDGWIVELHRTDDPGQRRALLDKMDKAGVLPEAQLDRLREDLDAGEGAGDDPRVVAILRGGILRGEMGLADITGANGLSPQGRRHLIDLWEANRDPALAKGVEEIRKGLGVTRGAAQNDDATVDAAAGAITDLKDQAAREENPDVRALGREQVAKARETLRERQGGGTPLSGPLPPRDELMDLMDAGDNTGGPSSELDQAIGEGILSLVPGVGEVMSARDAWASWKDTRAAWDRGDLGETIESGGMTALNVAGAIPIGGMVVRGGTKLFKISRVALKPLRKFLQKDDEFDVFVQLVMDQIPKTKDLVAYLKRVKNHTPLGFSSPEEVEEFVDGMQAILKGPKAKLDDVQIFMRGSSVTGKRFVEDGVGKGSGKYVGAAFDVGRTSDFDLVLVSPKLFQKLKSWGVELLDGGIRTDVVEDWALKRLGLANLLPETYGGIERHSSIVVHGSAQTLPSRGPFMELVGKGSKE